ncbi:MAG: hypothetical protein R2681_17045 [Pyrinomonadaceae bacterium]
MNLEESIILWDGRSKEKIETVYEKFSASKEFIEEVFVLCRREETETGATWLLKQHLESGVSISVEKKAEFFDLLKEPKAWEAKLHLLQCLPFFSIPASKEAAAAEFVRNCLTSRNKFVRAWAYGGFCKLAEEYPEYRDEARQFVSYAMNKEPASVKARIRNAAKGLFLESEL